MNWIKIICPKCNAEAKLSLEDSNYSGPRRCWKCHEAFRIRIENNKVVSCEPMSHEEFEKVMAAKKAEDKAEAQGFTFSKREEPETRQEAPQQQQEFFRPPVQKEAAGRAASQKPGPTFPPDHFNTFIPVEEPKDTEKKPQKPKGPPPDRFNIFIPPQT